MSHNWQLQKALLNSSPDIRVTVEWNDTNSYTAWLDNFGSHVNIIEGHSLYSVRGEGSTGPGAISSLFKEMSGKALEVVEGGTCARKHLVFTDNGYRPA